MLFSFVEILKRSIKKFSYILHSSLITRANSSERHFCTLFKTYKVLSWPSKKRRVYDDVNSSSNYLYFHKKYRNRPIYRLTISVYYG